MAKKRKNKRMRAPMVCFDTTFPKGRICRYTHRNIWTRLLGNSTSGHARRWSSQLRQKHLMHVLHRPVEPAKTLEAPASRERSSRRNN